MVTETYRAFAARATDILTKAGCDSPAFEVRCMVEDFAGRVRQDDPVPADVLARLERAVAERAARRPLPYILGNWDFLNLTLAVGEGVLCPRPDTETLCETAAAWLNASGVASPRVLDLCAGTGCVGLGVASLTPAVRPTEVEWSPAALTYLRRNVERTGIPAAIVRADVLADPPASLSAGFDALLANPPYIPSGDLPGLMPEVRCEPAMALDGGADGLRFYRAIVAKWKPLVRQGGLIAFEIGQDQEGDVAALLTANGVSPLPFVRDLAGIIRVVAGTVQ